MNQVLGRLEIMLPKKEDGSVHQSVFATEAGLKPKQVSDLLRGASIGYVAWLRVEQWIEVRYGHEAVIWVRDGGEIPRPFVARRTAKAMKAHPAVLQKMRMNQELGSMTRLPARHLRRIPRS